MGKVYIPDQIRIHVLRSQKLFFREILKLYVYIQCTYSHVVHQHVIECIYPLVFQAFEHLVALEFVFPAESGGVSHSMNHSGKVMKEYQPMILMLGEEQIHRAVRTYPSCPTDVSRWGTSSALTS